ncbi:MAG TPA: GH25 family lysozyme [Chthoniobacteraceae bacterium]|nr:GH25 family lysozyme [Chthoniobacteraceae bacterium]
MRARHVLVGAGIAAAILSLPCIFYFTGAWIPNLPPQDEYPVRGIDVSHHQGEIQWDKVAASGIRFAYIKATEGTTYDDLNFKANWDAAATAHVARGAYHFYVLGAPGKEQAAHFMAKVPVDPGTLPPAIDIELSGANTGVDSIPQFQRELEEFTSAIAAHYGRQPVVYTSRGFRNRYLQSVALDSWWITDTFFTPPKFKEQPWQFWQYSGHARVAGIAGFVDADVFTGTERDFQELLLKAGLTPAR